MRSQLYDYKKHGPSDLDLDLDNVKNKKTARHGPAAGHWGHELSISKPAGWLKNSKIRCIFNIFLYLQIFKKQMSQSDSRRGIFHGMVVVLLVNYDLPTFIPS